MKILMSRRLVTILLVVALTIGAGMWFFMNYLNRSRAGGGTATITLTSSVIIAPNEEFNLPVIFSVASGSDVVGADLVINFDTEYLEVVDVIPDPSVETLLSFLPKDANDAFDKVRVIQEANASGLVDIGAVVSNSTDTLSGTANVGSIRFKAKKNGITGATVMFSEGLTVESNVVDRDNVDILTSVVNSVITITDVVASTSTPTPPPVITDGLACSTAGDCVAPNRNTCLIMGCVAGRCVSQNNTNGVACTVDGLSGGGQCTDGVCAQSIVGATATPTPPPGATATATPPPGATATPVPDPNAYLLNLKLKFQGINTKPRNEYLHVKTTIAGGNLTAPISQWVLFIADNTGVYSSPGGGVPFSNFTPDPNADYTIYVQGVKHLRKKVCVATPTETEAGRYRCATPQGTIKLSTNTTALDFTGIRMIAGDFSAGLTVRESQNGVIDREDLALITQNLGSTDDDILYRADINMDGVINILGDYTAIIDSLSVRFGDD